MALATAIAQCFASIFSYLAARGIDAIVGRYLASLTVAFEKSASASAHAAYREAQRQIAVEMQGKWDQWEKWRNGK